MNLKVIKEFFDKNAGYKKHAIWATCSVVVVGTFCYWLYSRNYINTDDAYINANVTQMSPQVTGRVVKLHVQNNQFVQQGDALFDIDPIPFQMIVDRDQAQLEVTKLNVAQEAAAVVAALADVDMRQSDLQNAKQTADRIRQLLKKHYASQQNDDDAQAKLKNTSAALALATANLDEARKKLGTPGDENEQVRQAEAVLSQAKLNLAYTHVVAPTQGTITNMSLRAGDVVQANQPLFALISDTEFWADANFKETELRNIKPGQVAQIAVDMYPGHPFKGVVNSVSGGSGSAFSLLPPENATGNWVKVTQRVPVKVMIVDLDPKHPLRIGTTATVTIKVKA